MNYKISKNNNIKDISKNISFILSPLVFILITAIILTFIVEKSFIKSLFYPIILFILFSPGIYFRKVNKNSNYQKHKNRIYMFLLFLFGFIFSIIIFYLLGISNILIKMAISSLIVISIAMLINRYWNISFHSIIPFCCSALIYSININIAIFFVISGVIVGISRVFLGEHTLIQVVSGWFYGSSLTMLLLFLLI